jgi:hypothetical protein
MYAFSAALLRIDEALRPVYRVPSVTAAHESNESSSKVRSQAHSATLNSTSSKRSTDTASQIYNPDCSHVCLFVIILHSAAGGHGIYPVHISSPLLP